MRIFTAKELTDVLFQKPDRITARVLDQCGVKERILSPILGNNRKPASKYINSALNNPHNSISLKGRLFLHFNTCSKLKFTRKDKTKDKRSLFNAMRELQAIGFSNKQIYFLSNTGTNPAWLTFDRSQNNLFAQTSTLWEMDVRLKYNLSDAYNGDRVVLLDDRFFLGHVIGQKDGAKYSPQHSPFDWKELESQTYETTFLELQKMLDKHPMLATPNSQNIAQTRIPNLK
jgi:hypothetical protein